MPNAKRRPVPVSKIFEMYEAGKRPAEIAAHFGVSRQAVQERLNAAGIRVPRQVGRYRKTIDVEYAKRRYVTEKLSLKQIAMELGVSVNTVEQRLRQAGVKIRSTAPPLRYPDFADLEIGQSVEIPRPQTSQPLNTLYRVAKNRGIRVTLQTIDPTTIRITRTG